MDVNGRLVYCNSGVETIIGYKQDELVGKHYTQLVAPEWVDKTKLFYAQKFKDKQTSTNVQFESITKNGKRIWLEQTVTPLFEKGEITGFQAVARDISDRKEAELNLKRANKNH